MAEIFKNAAALEQKFKEHGYAVQRQLLTQATRAGAEVIQIRAEALAPRRTGHLAESELIRIDSSQSNAAEVVAKIGPDKSAFYGLFQEFGTAFMPAQPFLNPALEQVGDKALEVSAEIIGKGLERLA